MKRRRQISIPNLYVLDRGKCGGCCCCCCCFCCFGCSLAARVYCVANKVCIKNWEYLLHLRYQGRHWALAECRHRSAGGECKCIAESADGKKAKLKFEEERAVCAVCTARTNEDERMLKENVNIIILPHERNSTCRNVHITIIALSLSLSTPSPYRCPFLFSQIIVNAPERKTLSEQRQPHTHTHTHARSPRSIFH